MFDLIRNSLLAGLGAGVLTKEKVNELTRELVDQGKLTADEASQFAEKLMNSGNQQWNEIQHNLTETLRRALDRMDVAREKDLDAVAQRLTRIEQRVAILEDAVDRLGPARPDQPGAVPPVPPAPNQPAPNQPVPDRPVPARPDQSAHD